MPPLLRYAVQRLGRAAIVPGDWLRTQALVASDPAPYSVGAEVVLAIAASSLAAAEAGDAELRALIPEPSLREPQFGPGPAPAEWNRLLAKGRQLYEHCMVELSGACMIGFFHHELQKSRTAERVVGELIRELVQERLRTLAEPQDEDDRVRAAWTEVMIDHGVSYLFGLTRATADALARGKEPVA